MNEWMKRARLLAALAALCGAMACSRGAETTSAAAITCADAPDLPGWTVERGGIAGVGLRRADGVTATLAAVPVGPITGEQREMARTQVLAGNWQIALLGPSAPGYSTYETSLPGITLYMLVNDTDDSHGNCGDSGCRMFVNLNERGVSLDTEMPVAVLPNLAAILTEIEPEIAHVQQHCEAMLTPVAP